MPADLTTLDYPALEKLLDSYQGQLSDSAAWGQELGPLYAARAAIIREMLRRDPRKHYIEPYAGTPRPDGPVRTSNQPINRS